MGNRAWDAWCAKIATEENSVSDWAIRDLPMPSAFIQWKGTEVCMDIYCVCGHHSHFDGWFAYAVKCPKCKKILEVSAKIELRPLADGEVWNGCTPVEPKLEEE